MIDLKISAKQTARILGTLAALFILLHCVVLYLHLFRGHDTIFGLSTLLNLNAERNLPTCFSALLLGFSAMLFTIEAYAVSDKNLLWDRISWTFLAIVFTILSVDEIIEIHEKLGLIFETAFSLQGYFRYGWVIPYGLFVGFFIIVYVRFWWRLPKPTRNLLLLAFVLFVGGALGMEMISAEYADQHNFLGINPNNLKIAQKYYFMVTIEESLEMAGSITLIYALLNHLSNLPRKVILTISK